MSERQTTICAGDVVQDGDGMQWQVQAVSRTSLGWLCCLSLTRTGTEGQSLTRTARPCDVTLVGQQYGLEEKLASSDDLSLDDDAGIWTWPDGSPRLPDADSV